MGLAACCTTSMRLDTLLSESRPAQWARSCSAMSRHSSCIVRSSCIHLDTPCRITVGHVSVRCRQKAEVGPPAKVHWARNVSSAAVTSVRKVPAASNKEVKNPCSVSPIMFFSLSSRNGVVKAPAAAEKSPEPVHMLVRRFFKLHSARKSVCIAEFDSVR